MELERWEKVVLVQQMQDFLLAHPDGTATDMELLYRKTGYSRRHAVRIFQELLGRTPEEYARALRLTASAKQLLDEKRTILDIALDSSYENHEGYSKAFFRQFGATPSAYRRGDPPIPWLIPHPIRHAYLPEIRKECNKMEQNKRPCTVTIVNRPRRKLLVMYSLHAVDYWTFCEERGCEWEGLFNSIPGRLDTAALLDLPPVLQKEGMSPVAAGVELPQGYSGAVPDGCALLSLPACDMMFFQSAPFENEDDFPKAIGEVWAVMEQYDPTLYGYAYAPELAPRYNFGADSKTGARMAVPVIRR
jgi:AraC family transcriptional regulator